MYRLFNGSLCADNQISSYSVIKPLIAPCLKINPSPKWNFSRDGFLIMLSSHEFLLLPEQVRKISHSCYPNCGISKTLDLVALRDILEGEPLSIDYSTMFTGNLPGFHCSCSLVGCRNKILGINLLPLRFQEKYLLSGLIPHPVLLLLDRELRKAG